MTITASMVRELRDRTGAAMMDCKKALEAASGDMEAAVDHLRKQGLKTAAKKASRETSEGRVRVELAADGRSGALVALACETDFVSATPDFQAFLDELARTALSAVSGRGEEAVQSLLAAQSAAGGGTIEERLQQVIGKLGENIRLAAAARFEAPGGRVGSYVHHNHKFGAMVAVESDAPREKLEPLLTALSQHIVVFKPAYRSREEIPAGEVERERAVQAESEDVQSKPADKRERIVAGKLEKFFQTSALLEQPWIHDDKQTVQKALAAALGANASLTGFVLVQI